MVERRKREEGLYWSFTALGQSRASRGISGLRTGKLNLGCGAVGMRRHSGKDGAD